MNDIISFEEFFPGEGWQLPSDYKILFHRDNVMIVEDALGYRIKITGHVAPGSIVHGALQSHLGARPVWRSSDPECRRPESFVTGHPENSEIPLCFTMRTHALHGIRPWQHQSPYKKRLASSASNELSKRRR